MKKLLILALFNVCALKVIAQTKDTSTVYTRLTDLNEIPPSFPGGDWKLEKFINKNLKYPQKAWDSNVQGRVVVSFIIEKDGSLTEIKVVRSLSSDTDEEALRIINKSPKWIPGKQAGQPVRVLFTLPILFSLKN